MPHLMFDIDGTLVESFDFDERCFVDSVEFITGVEFDRKWHTYPHITDRGLLMEFVSRAKLDVTWQRLENKVKPEFIRRVELYLLRNKLKPIAGAIGFMSQVLKINDITVSLATGGWSDTAKMKLNRAGFDINDLTIATSDDHFARTEIMREALRKSNVLPNERVIYFGDGEWDQEACEQLGFEFVQIGRRFEGRHQQIDDFTHTKELMRLIL